MFYNLAVWMHCGNYRPSKDFYHNGFWSTSFAEELLSLLMPDARLRTILLNINNAASGQTWKIIGVPQSGQGNIPAPKSAATLPQVLIR